MPRQITVTFELPAEAAAGLKRFAEKVSRDQAKEVLYAHVPSELREDQAAEIIRGFAILEQALSDVGVHSWPWIESGRVDRG
jgi:hypothetical protein